MGLTCVLEEADASGVAQTDYICLNGQPVAVLNGSTIYYLHDDMLGTPQLATDSSQNIQWQASYDPFGQASVSGTITQNLRFPDQYFDVENGWNHNGFRDYIPELGRYIEPDPLGRPGSGNNLYAYVNNNPVNAIDPFGLLDVYIWSFTGTGPKKGTEKGRTGPAPRNAQYIVNARRYGLSIFWQSVVNRDSRDA